MNSNLFRLNWKDLVKGIWVAFFTAVLTALIIGLQTVLSTGAFPTIEELQKIGLSALSTGLLAILGYLSKNLLSDQNGNVTIKKPE